MSPAVAAPPRLLNFVVVGEVRAGTSAVQSAVSHRPGAVCHGDLFYGQIADPAHDAVRRAAHEAYFGACDDQAPAWLTGGTNPWYYMTTVLADRRRDEAVVGARLTYPTIRALELFSLIEHKYHEGDFCVLHVVRNPIACFVSLKQAQATNVWRVENGLDLPREPPAVWIEPPELVQFVRQHLALEAKIRRACPDALVINYHDLLYSFQAVMRQVWHFLEFEDDTDDPAIAGVQRLRNRVMLDRVHNWDDVRREAGRDVAALIDRGDLI